ncbi:hypothetical protein K490DRAFT_41578 [Saccharata proteae CBS 121410]|uniref:Uncharacterized protein n=1 Tax=Saccharata proteae CBS 121410 TaxID=1314787 RepID=A0A9P4HVZ0_9PEZI|nr:hypothetical protein K490DRAFT_41578 [Saccharata proteae CBS 121410]
MAFGRTFSITEPHPSVSSDNAYFHSGRGGAGNVTRVSKKDITPGPNAQGPASRVKLPAPPTNHYYLSGRGGAGNMQRGREQAIFSFDEELEQQRRMQEHAAPVYHIGRGGNGNFIDETKPSPTFNRKSSSSSTTSNDSTASNKSAKVRRSMEGAWAGMKRTLSAR